jgi:hypothetical protein
LDRQIADRDIPARDEKRPIEIVHVDRVAVTQDVHVGVEDELAGGGDITQDIDRVGHGVVGHAVAEDLGKRRSQFIGRRDIRAPLGPE